MKMKFTQKFMGMFLAAAMVIQSVVPAYANDNANDLFSTDITDESGDGLSTTPLEKSGITLTGSNGNGNNDVIIFGDDNNGNTGDNTNTNGGDNTNTNGGDNTNTNGTGADDTKDADKESTDPEKLQNEENSGDDNNTNTEGKEGEASLEVQPLILDNLDNKKIVVKSANGDGITLNVNGGTFVGNTELENFNQSSNEIAGDWPVKENAAFTGWYWDADGTQLASDTSSESARNLSGVELGETLYAGWTTDYYTITFYAGEDGRISDSVAQDGTKEGEEKTKTIRVPKNSTQPIGWYMYYAWNHYDQVRSLENSDKVFIYWKDQNGAKFYGDDVMNVRATSDMTFTATANPKVTFYAGEGTFEGFSGNDSYAGNYNEDKTEASIEVQENTRLSEFGTYTNNKTDWVYKYIPYDPTPNNEDYAFDGWFIDEACTQRISAVDLLNTIVTTDKSFYAGYRRTDSYKITFRPGKDYANFTDGSKEVVIEVKKGQPLTYNSKVNASPIIDFATANSINGSQVPTGYWICGNEKYYFSNQGGLINKGAEVISGNDSYYMPSSGFIPTSDMVFTAEWKNAVTVTFQAAENATIDYNAAFTTQDGQVRVETDPYLEFTDETRTTLKFTAPAGRTLGDFVLLAPAAHDNDDNMAYTWGYDKTGKGLNFYTVVNSNITVYGKKNTIGDQIGTGPNSGETIGTVTLHAEGATILENGYTKYEDEMVIEVKEWSSNSMSRIIQVSPKDPDMAFAGWYTDPECTKKYGYIKTQSGMDRLVFPQEITDLYAKFVTSYKVTFDANGGYFDETSTTYSGANTGVTAITAPVTPGKDVDVTYYTNRVRHDSKKVFAGWYEDQECTVKAKTTKKTSYGESYTPKATVTLYAKWTASPKANPTIKLTPATIKLNIGGTAKLNAQVTGESEDNVRYIISSVVCGNSNRDSILPAAIDDEGNVRAQAEGTVKVYAQINGVRSNIATITVASAIATTVGKITYTLNGGVNNNNNPSYYTKGDEVELLPATRNGYIFAGWYADAKLTKEVDETTFASGKAVTVYAKWEGKNCTIYYNANGGTFAGEDEVSTTAVYGAVYPKNVPAVNPTRVGYTFAGWYTAAVGGTKVTPGTTKFAPANARTDKVYAHWTDAVYTVNFHSNLAKDTKIAKTYKLSVDATKTLDPQTILGKNIFTAANADKFEGWAQNSGTALFANTTTVEELINAFPSTAAKVTVDLYAQWEETSEYYTVKFLVGNVDNFDPADFVGSEIGTIDSDDDLIQYATVYVDQQYMLTGREILRKGYTLNGWTYVNDRKQKVTLKPTASFKNLTGAGKTVELTAVWSAPQSYTVKTNLNGGKYTGTDKLPVKYSYSTTYTLPTSQQMVRTGYTFTGWTVNGQTVTGLGKGSDCETGNVTLYANWQKISYTYSFNLNGGSFPYEWPESLCTMRYDDSISLASLKATRNGYNFKNWTYVGDDGKVKTIAANGAIKNLTTVAGKEIEITANWTPITYTITYNLNGGKLATAAKNYTNASIADSSKVMFGVPTKTGYSFAGWTLVNKPVATPPTASFTYVADENDANKIKGYTLTPESYGNVVLYADYVPMTYTVHLMDKNGEIDYALNYQSDKLYTDTMNFMDLTKEFAKEGVITEGKSIKGYALNTRDAQRGTVKYALGTNYKISDIVAATKTTGTDIYLYATEENEKYYVTTAWMPDLAGGESTLQGEKTYYYDKNRDYKITAPKITGYTVDGWKIVANDGTGTIEELPGEAGKDYVIDSAKNLTIKAECELFKNRYLIAVMKPQTYKIKLVPNAGDVFAAGAEKAVATAGADYMVDGATAQFEQGDTTAALSFDNYSWSRAGYTLTGFSLTNKGAVLSGGANANVADLFAKADRNKFVKLYAIWTPNTNAIDYNVDCAVIVNGSDDGTVYTDISQEYNALKADVKTYTYTKNLTLPVLKRTGYKFLGWKEAGAHNANVTLDKNGYATKVGPKNTEDLSFVAYFEELTYKLSFNPNGGLYNGSKNTVVLKEKVRYSEDIKPIIDSLATYERAGYATPNWTVLALSPKAPTGNLNASQAKQWVQGYMNSYVNEQGQRVYTSCVLYSTKAVTIYPQWDGGKLSVSKPERVTAYYMRGGETDQMNLSVTWSSTGNRTDFEMQYASNPTFLYGVQTVICDAPYAQIENLPGKKYYVRVRTRLKDSTGGYLVGAWSTTVSGIANTTIYQTLKVNHVVDGAAAVAAADRLGAVNQSLLQALGTPKRAGYDFKGWYRDAQCSAENQVTSDVMVADNEYGNQYYAKFEPSTFKISFNWGTGVTGGAKLAAKDVVYTRTYPELPTVGNAKKTGYTFAGWYLGDQKIEEGDQVQITANTTLTAGWTPNNYEVSFNLNYATEEAAPAAQTVTYAATYGDLPVVEREGYTFNGWYTAASKGTKVTGATKVAITKDQTLFAQWAVKSYKVNFNANAPQGMTASGKMTVQAYKYTEKKALTANAFKVTGHTFLGWATTADATTAEFTDRKAVSMATDLFQYADASGNVKLYGVWKPIEYTVTFSYGKNLGSKTVKADYGTEVASLTEEIEASFEHIPGYAFSGWYTANNYAKNTKVSAANKNTKVTGNRTYYGFWAVVYQNVYFEPMNGQQTINVYDKQYGTNIWKLKPAKNPTKTGYVFDGWWTTPDDLTQQGEQLTETTTLGEESVTYYARWKQQ
ncbi:InlB B-repeat-containing protein [Butyrivibrio sp. VCB2006]|uniref:InlB B-repeat-containing protein n=1 Tax=Butyrivibrio sp. VCB2006 TaxID=1280679 RepID=UPI0004001FFF|nr:InlB B-repeat-containing protein [Butyrivibrio sp. VCB2006]